MRERGGNTKAMIVQSSAGQYIIPEVIKNIAIGSNIHADDNISYSLLDEYYFLSRVNHSAGEYVRGNTHTNGIENIWALLKRSYIGIHHHWSRKHAQNYINICTYRINHKESKPLCKITDLLTQGMSSKLF